MNKFMTAFVGIFIGTCLIIGSAQADNNDQTTELNKCQKCVWAKCLDETSSCLSTGNCMDVIGCISSCKDNEACPKRCAANADSRDALNKAVILFSCLTTHAATDCSNVCS